MQVHHLRRVVHAVRSDGFAGVERYICDVAAELTRRGIEVAIIGGSPRQMPLALVPGIDWSPASTMARTAFGLRRERSASIVHVHMTAAELAARFALSRRTKLVATRHFVGERGRGLRGAVIRRVVEPRLNGEIFISEYASRSRAGATVLLNGVADEPMAATSDPVVLAVQRLTPEKRPEDLLEIWQRSDLHREGWTFRIAGDGALRASLEARIERDAIAGVELLGKVSDTAALRQQARLAIAPAPAEGFGLSVVELMAAGIPVVSCGSGAHLETIGRAAPELLYEPGDLDTAARVLRSLATDEPGRKTLGTRIQDHQRRHLTLRQHVDGLIAVYEQVLGG